VLAVLLPHVSRLDVGSLERTFTIRGNEGFVAGLSASLVAAIHAAAPRVRVRFAPKPEKDARALREGQIDLEIGVLGAFAPEVRTQALFRDSFVGVARIGHPLVAGTNITLEQYAACDHVVASRRGDFTGPVDDALEKLGLSRKVAVVVPGFPDAGDRDFGDVASSDGRRPSTSLASRYRGLGMSVGESATLMMAEPQEPSRLRNIPA
jgi:DNA-binding transcriptional LysR family regulator